ncbi:MAG: DUF1616 domain-containing protein [Promethearchaeota archaeon]
MSEDKNSDKISELEQSDQELGKLVKIILIIGILVVSGFIVYYLFHQEPGYVGLGILNDDKKAEDYPTEAKINEEISFYVTVENHMGKEFTFRLKVYRGDEDTKLTSEGVKDADLDFTTRERTLKDGDDWMSDKYSLSFQEIGEDHKIIVELYEVNEEDKLVFNNIVYLRLNITA